MAKSSAAPKRILATRTDHLPVQLTESEIREAGKKLAHLEGQLAEHTAKEKDVKDSLKATRSQIEGQVHGLAGVIRQGYEYRPTPVRVEADYKQGRVFEIREDTGEVIGERPVNETDRQAPLFDAAPPEKGEPLDALVGTRAEAIERQAQKKSGELDWKPEGENLVARVEGGVYCVEPGWSGGFNALWTPDGGRSGRLSTVPPGKAAKATALADCARHAVERQADGILANAGDGELTKKELKGDATARKKGGRR